MNKITLFLLLLVFISVGKLTVKAQAPAQCQDIMLQAFYWDSYTDSKWTNLNSKASEIASNFSLVWLPPSGNCKNSTSMGYAPIYWFNQNSAFGTQSELKTLISSLKANGSKAIADVVVNHRSGVSNWTNFPTEIYNGVTYPMGPAQICNTDEVKNQPLEAKPTGAADTGDDFNGSRDLDHTGTTVRDAIKGYLQFLKNEMGYSGWRYDMTKGFSASYVKEYNASADNYFSVGECFDGYDRCNDWLDGCDRTSTTFDFAAKFQLNEAWKSGMDLTKLVWQYNGVNQPAGLIHHPDNKRYAVTFVDNHDTYRDNNKFNGNVLAAYAFLMGSPGVPCVFLKHWNDNKAAIFTMIAARKAVKLNSESVVTVNQSAANIYVATATGLNGTLIVKIGSGNYTPPVGYTLATSGTDYAIWTKTTTAVAPSLLMSPAGGTYYSQQTVAMVASTSGASVYYTTNNTAPTKTSTLYSLPFVISGSQTVRAIAYDPLSQLYSAESSNTYTISSVPTSIRVRFNAPAGWTACKIHSWYGASSTSLTGLWPGMAMTLDAHGYYSYSVTGFTSLPIGIVFNNGAGSSQTVDLSASKDMCWEADASPGSPYTATEVTCLFTGIENPSDASWKIYPNPTHDLINFPLPADVNKIKVTSALGSQLPVKPTFISGSCQIDLSAYPSGVYYITLSGLNGNIVTKAVMKY